MVTKRVGTGRYGKAQVGTGKCQCQCQRLSKKGYAYRIRLQISKSGPSLWILPRLPLPKEGVDAFGVQNCFCTEGCMVQKVFLLKGFLFEGG